MKIRVLLGACLLAAVSSAAYALGLGEILVKSKLNQPLEAEILVREASPGEAEQLVAKLASQEDFARVGLERARMPVMLRFETGKNERGQTIIRVRSDDPVREPFLTLLVEANWSGGRLLREYGLLLDPPVTAPASSIARTAPPPAAPAAPAQTQALADTPPPSPEPPPAERVEAPPAATPAPAAQPAPATRPAAPPPPGFAAPAEQRRPTPAPTPAAPPAPAAPTPAPAAAAAPADGSYTVQRGDTLSSIAREYAGSAGVSANQMMLAIQRENPRAFFNDNINALRAGAVLRIPDADAASSVRGGEASAEVRRQNSSWTGVSALADAGSSRPSATQARPAAAAGDRLELVPPGREGSSNQAAGRAGNDQGGAEVAGLQSELQRSREDLRSREQELSELNSRVRDLEELNAKNSRLLELKNAEVAELQRRLADASAASAATPAESTAAAAPAAPVEAPAAAPAEPAPADTISSDTEASTTGADQADATTDVPAAETESAPADTAGTEGTDVADTAEEVSEADWEAEATAAPEDPFAAEEEAGANAADAWAPGEPVAETPAPTAAEQTPPPAAAVAQTPVQTPAASDPWYMNPMIQGGALVAIALVLLIVLLSRRKRQQAVAAVEEPRRSVADLFSDAPVAGAAAVVASDALSDEAQALEAQIEADPNDFGAYLELLSIHYANGDAQQFEYWAERFHARPGSEISEEWDNVRSMGAEILPGHVLFGGDAAPATPVWSNDDGDFDAALPDPDPIETVELPAEPVISTPARQVYDVSGAEFNVEEDKVEDLGEEAPAIDFDPSAFRSVTAESRRDPEPPTARVAGDEPALPDLDFGSAGNSLDLNLDDADSFVSTPVTPVSLNDDLDDVLDSGGGLDDAATKLELARAYLDMGDPEGARAMLEEVLGEGDTSQREAARKLLSTL